MASIAFDIFCGNCFRTIIVPSSDGGSLLSCGDFLCKECASTKIGTIGCPVCGKQGVRAVFLNDALPNEVKRNITDPTKEFQNFYGTIGFQMRYYKEMIRRLISKLQQYGIENEKQKSQIKELEQTIRQKQTAPSFFSKDPDQRSDIFENNEFFKNSRREFGSEFLPASTTVEHARQPASSYYKNVPYQERDVLPPSVTTLQQRSPHPIYIDQQHQREPLPRTFVSNQRGAIPEPPDNNSSRKRIYTPSRTIYSAQPNQMPSVTPSRIRSPCNQIIRSPSAYAFVPESAHPRMNAYAQPVSAKEVVTRRDTQSPITSFIQQRFK